MRLAVDPDRLAETAAPLRAAADVAREVHGAGGSLAGHVAGAGCEPLRRATEDFLDAWGRGLGALADRGEGLARMLELAAAAYGDAEERMRRHAAQAEPGSVG